MIVRRTHYSAAQISQNMSARRRKTIHPEQLALLTDGQLTSAYAYSFIWAAFRKWIPIGSPTKWALRGMHGLLEQQPVEAVAARKRHRVIREVLTEDDPPAAAAESGRG